MTGTGPQRILAVDYGDRRTGLAGTDPTGTLALPLDILVEGDRVRLVRTIVEIAREREAELVLVGIPLAPDGGLGARGEKTREFARLLARSLAPIPVQGIDERHSSGGAHERLKQAGMKAARRKRKGIDAVAAQLILESWMAGATPLEL